MLANLVLSASFLCLIPGDLDLSKDFTTVTGNCCNCPCLVSKFLGRRAPGPDHGDDPNDEQRQDLPNGGPDGKHYGDGYPSQDPYDDTVRNSRKPYPAPNNPY